MGRSAADPNAPHALPRHGKIHSASLLIYYWIDFLLGSWLKVRATKVRTGLVVWERGWWDFAVDPARYRLAALSPLVRLLSVFLPQPDLMLILDVPGDIATARKPELSEEEVERQRSTWRSVVPAAIAQRIVDASLPVDQVTEIARRHIVRALNDRAVRHLGAGWATMPRTRDARWILPRGPRSVAYNGLSIYQPVTGGGRSAWRAARVLAAAGGFRLLPRGGPPIAAVRDLVAPYLPSGGNLSMMRVRGGRYVVLILDRNGEPQAIAKVATNPDDYALLERESESLTRLAPLLGPPLQGPELLDTAPGLILMRMVRWQTRRRPWHLDRAVASALGEFFRATGKTDGHGVAHGDFAPWNVLETGAGWTVVDWERAREDAPPAFDLFHYVVQSHVLLGRPKTEGILSALRGEGWFGHCLATYCDSAELSLADSPDYLATYLEESRHDLDARSKDGRMGVEIRRTLLSELHR